VFRLKDYSSLAKLKQSATQRRSPDGSEKKERSERFAIGTTRSPWEGRDRQAWFFTTKQQQLVTGTMYLDSLYLSSDNNDYYDVAKSVTL